MARDLTPACDEYRITYGATAGLLADIRGFKKENALRKASSVSSVVFRAHELYFIVYAAGSGRADGHDGCTLILIQHSQQDRQDDSGGASDTPAAAAAGNNLLLLLRSAVVSRRQALEDDEEQSDDDWD